MDDKLRDSFYQAYVGEAKAALRLKVYAEKAEQENYPQVAKLFRVIAHSEEIHGIRSLRLLKEIKGTYENLTASFESESKVAGVAYDNFIRLANEAGDESAATILSQARDVEDTHAKLYQEAMGHLLEERETTYYVCPVCGYVSDGVLPDECPVCGAKKDKFETF
ncbi:MAG: rubrerythrin family protein [Deltaproteobacteria bacterium]|nr:MAG: rubrerythrin family protein [Deltaproteobacteria bacterium]